MFLISGTRIFLQFDTVGLIVDSLCVTYVVLLVFLFIRFLLFMRVARVYDLLSLIINTFIKSLHPVIHICVPYIDNSFRRKKNVNLRVRLRNFA